MSSRAQLFVGAAALAVSGVGCWLLTGSTGEFDGAEPEDASTESPGFDAASEAAATSDLPVTCAEAAERLAYVGCDFWPTVVANPVHEVFDFAVVVANIGDNAASVDVTGPGGVARSTTVAAGSLATVYLPWVKALKGPDSPDCSTAPGLTSSVRVNKGAYHLVSSRPVSVFQFNALEYRATGGPSGKSWSACGACGATGNGCFSYTNDASLLLPSTALSGTYRVLGTTGMQLGGVSQAPYIAVTATRDGTKVSVQLGARGAIVAGAGVVAAAAGTKLQLTLDAGDVAELLSGGGELSDLSGALVSATQPIQVISGVPCLQNPIGTVACDHLEESVFPVETLGKDYFVGVPTAPRGSPVGHTVRLVGNRDATSLTYSPTKPAGAPDVINAGQVVDLGRLNSELRITGSNEFSVASIMLGGTLVDPGSVSTGKGRGDPSLSFVVPVEQYRTRFVFLAPSDYDVSYADITHPESATMTLDGEVIPPGKPIGATGFMLARVKLGPGRGGAHLLVASKPVGVQVMGYGAYTSYHYPGGLNLGRIAPPPIR